MDEVALLGADVQEAFQAFKGSLERLCAQR